MPGLEERLRSGCEMAVRPRLAGGSLSLLEVEELCRLLFFLFSRFSLCSFFDLCLCLCLCLDECFLCFFRFCSPSKLSSSEPMDRRELPRVKPRLPDIHSDNSQTQCWVGPHSISVHTSIYRYRYRVRTHQNWSELQRRPCHPCHPCHLSRVTRRALRDSHRPHLVRKEGAPLR